MAYQSEIEKLEARFREKPEQWFAALADAYRKAGDVDMALEVLGAWIDKRPTYTSGHIVRGRCLLDRERYGEAAGAFEHVLGLDVENVIALKSLADIAERQGDAVAARKWLQRLLDVDPMNREAQEGLDRVGAGAPSESAAPPPGSPEAIAAPALSFLDLGADAEPAELTLERTEEAFDLSAMAPGGGEKVELLEGLETSVTADTPEVREAPEALEGLETSGAVEGPESTGEDLLLERATEPEGVAGAKSLGPPAASEPIELMAAGYAEEPVTPPEPVETPEAVTAAEPAAAAEALDAPEAVVEPVEPVHAAVREPPVKTRADGPSPSLDLATAASDWVIPEPPPPAPKPRAAEPPAAEPVRDASVEAILPDLEPAEFESPEEAEPVPIEGLAPSAFEAAFEEFAAQAGPLETAAEFEASEELEILEAPVGPAWAPSGRRSTADDVEFVEQPHAEAEPPAPPAKAASAEPVRNDVELPLILPEEVSADLDEPSIREPEPVVTETMAALYASQGLFRDAHDIYARLLERDPDNARLQGLLADIDEQAKAQAPPPRRERYSAGAAGGLSVGELMRALAGAAPEAGAEPETGTEPEAVAEPKQNAKPPTAAPGATSGFSFDEFFSEEAPADGAADAAADDPGPEDEGFQDWLDGLKT